MTIETLLRMSAAWDVVLVLFFLGAAIAAFLSRYNGLTRAMGIVAVATVFYLIPQMISGLVDITLNPGVRYNLLVARNIFKPLLILSLVYLVYKVIKTHE